VPTRRLVLASASLARRRLLVDAGFDPEVMVSGVDERDLRAETPAEIVLELAIRKAGAVAERLGNDSREPPAIVVGCDSLLDVDGRAVGKPADRDAALAHWHAVRGRNGILVTGHAVIDLATGKRVSGVAATTVRFGQPTDDELAVYVGTGEPLAVAGAFTIEGRGAPFIDGVDGDPSNVVGLSLPLLRRLLTELGLSITDLWS
jgi:septum formation protein